MLKRLLGAGLGWTFGGPIGGLIGWWIAGKVGEEKQYRGNQYQFGEQPAHTTPSDFVVTLIILASEVIKADGHIKKEEIVFVKSFFLKHYDAEMVQEMMMFLKDIQTKEYSLSAVAAQINDKMTEEEKIQIIHFLFGICLADGDLHPKENQMIGKISVILHIPSHIFLSIKNQYLKHGDNLGHSYRILDIKKNSSIEEIKKSYRELSMKFHPDKVAHLGEEVKKSAEEKFKIIAEAYQKIKNERKF